MDDEEIKDYLVNHVFRKVSYQADYATKENIRGLLDEIWPRIKNIPTAKSGKYHPSICNVEPYGLMNHVIRVMHFLEHLIREEDMHGSRATDLMIAALFHDIGKCKFHEFKRYNRWFDHGDWASDWLKERGMPRSVYRPVKLHMAHWDDKVFKPDDIYARMLAYADYLASRKVFILRREPFFVPVDGEVELMTEEKYLADKGQAEKTFQGDIDIIGLKKIDLTGNVELDGEPAKYYSQLKDHQEKLKNILKEIDNQITEVEEAVYGRIGIGEEEIIGRWKLYKNSRRYLNPPEDFHSALEEKLGSDAYLLIKRVKEHYKPDTITNIEKMMKRLGYDKEVTQEVLGIMGLDEKPVKKSKRVK